ARPRRGDGGDEGRLARVRESHEADVGEEAEHEPQGARFAGETRLHAPRRLIGRGREAGVAASTAAAAGDDDLGVGARQIGDELARLRVEDARPGGYADDA